MKDAKISWPRSLTRGDLIGVFAPSEPLWGARSDAVDTGCALLGQHGFRTKKATNINADLWDAAGTPDQRISDIHALLRDSAVSCLAGAWGGKAANQLVGEVDYDLFRRAKKPMWGFSDVAVLLNDLSAVTGVVTYFGPNVVGKLDETRHADLELLRDPSASRGTNPFLSRSDHGHWDPIIAGEGTGNLFGGNLSTFVLGLSGSTAASKMKNVAFFWESSGDTPQIIKQHLHALVNSGFMREVKCMIVGDVRWPDDGYAHQPIEDLLLEFGERFSIPTYRCPTFGHADLPNPIIPIGAPFRYGVEPGASGLI